MNLPSANCLGLMLCVLANAAAADDECTIRLTDVTAATGIEFRHTDGATGEYYIVESVVAGLALFDYDGDGLIDIYFTNGSPVGRDAAGERPRDALYRNNGDWTFTDVTERAGVGDQGFGLGVTVADYDNDGDQDLYLNNFGPNVLYRNNGDGTFSDVTTLAGVDRGSRVGAGACFLDIDADGDLDLYAASYVDFQPEKNVVRMVGPHRFHPGPADFPPMRDYLFRNNGDGTFADASEAAGIAAVSGAGMGMISFDCDDDGDSDVFVCNDHGANFLFLNDGRGQFTEMALASGLAFDLYGNANGHMAPDCGDYNGDGLLDIYVTDYASQMPILYHNLGGGLFEDATRAARAGSGAFPHVKWGTGFVDFDLDGDADLFIATGHFMDNLRFIDDRTSPELRNILLMNNGDGKFIDVSSRSGSGLEVVASSRGAGFDDLDNDGDVDVAILNSNDRPTILRNDSPTGNRWLQVALRGVSANRDGVGARVRLTAGGRTQVAEVHSGRGYQGHFGSRLTFGLAGAARVDRIEVRWLGGARDVFTGIPANRLIVLTEGTSQTDRE
ncbi:MAG: VCBS repeat-containing protein [Thermoguttaceae bacterium]|nr:VCBS repeat-containing protein [Thermoguttaceae bacterium]